MPQTMSPKKPSLVDYTPEESSPETPEDTTATSEDASISVYSRNFEQHLIDHGIHPRGRGYSDRLRSLKPNNAEEIIQRLTQYRRSLSPSSVHPDHQLSQELMVAFRWYNRATCPTFDSGETSKASIEGNYGRHAYAPMQIHEMTERTERSPNAKWKAYSFLCRRRKMIASYKSLA